MTYSDALFFTGKCLTLECYPEKTEEVRAEILSGAVEWERIVWIATSHFVFSALHLQLERAGLMPLMPADLVEYMEEFTALNRDHNRRIISQSREITALLNEHGLAPIFLKGTAHLLDGLYGDIAERMVGDIDFLMDEKDIPRAMEVLQKGGYHIYNDEDPKNVRRNRHYPVLTTLGEPATVEIHRWAVKSPYYKTFSFELMDRDKKEISVPGRAYVLSAPHQIIHNMMVVQMNDGGYRRGNFRLRPMYDLFLLSQKNDPCLIASEFGRYFHWFNAYLALSSTLLGKPASLSYQPDWQAKLYLRRIRLNVTYPKITRACKFPFLLLEQICSYLSNLIQSIYRKDIRRKLYRKLNDPEWYQKHFKRLSGRG